MRHASPMLFRIELVGSSANGPERIRLKLSIVLVPTGFEKGQEKSRRRKDERTTILNPTSCGHQIGQLQAMGFFQSASRPTLMPGTFSLTINQLGVLCGQKWFKVVKQIEVVGSGDSF
jgi:hypothetical protein